MGHALYSLKELNQKWNQDSDNTNLSRIRAAVAALGNWSINIVFVELDPFGVKFTVNDDAVTQAMIKAVV